MSNRLAGKTLQTAALVGILLGATALSGCTAIGNRAFADRTTTGSVLNNAQANGNQPMPTELGKTRVAANHFVPPTDIGGDSSPVVEVATGVPTSGVIAEDLPVITSSLPVKESSVEMSAQPLVSPVVQTKSTTVAVTAPDTKLVSVPSDAYVHEIRSGESLYTIARHYGVTAQAIIQANGFGSPDKIFVGQKVVIPGKKAGPKPIVGDEETRAPTVEVASRDVNVVTPIETPEVIKPKEEPAKPLVQPKVEPVLSGNDKFRWPASGKVITDFAASKATGINIEVPEGAAIRAAENGQVIYVGSGVEGYGNLILIRHPNGYVSAYAHLKAAAVKKGDVVNRGDNIGSAGMTGGVSRPQLHFELRKGATPVDPVPLLAS